MTINFDMDGTLVNFYGVKGWLDDLKSENTRPYEDAHALGNIALIARQINRLRKLGHKVNIISWTSKSGSDDFQKRIAEAKKAWLSKHLPSVTFDNISIVPYGTPKSTCGKGILFDDEERNRNEWGEGAYDATEICRVLSGIK